jgi:sarcosine oxidase
VLEFSADGAVVTAGAWSRPLLDGLVDLPPLRVTEEHPAHFAILAPYADANWPSFNHFLPTDREGGFRGNVYGMLTPGEGVKVGFHATGQEVDPDARRFRASDDDRAKLRDYVAEWFPGLDPDSAEEISCTYTMTESERFVLDREGTITVGAGFSGQGFKFVPAIGRVLADASLGVADAPESFRRASH